MSYEVGVFKPGPRGPYEGPAIIRLLQVGTPTLGAIVGVGEKGELVDALLKNLHELELLCVDPGPWGYGFLQVVYPTYRSKIQLVRKGVVEAGRAQPPRLLDFVFLSAEARGKHGSKLVTAWLHTIKRRGFLIGTGNPPDKLDGCETAKDGMIWWKRIPTKKGEVTKEEELDAARETRRAVNGAD